ncbi:type II secretion system protein [Cryobacterium sp. TMT2-17-1]|uniref:type IV pilus modification PilV family protein n=1 Tax=Cryobacterium sp. TMT2-17-1 TaxID=1259248 RepID=UPI00141AFA61|nr:type II secretion system protein [Cryobacterium sp. TMT2-17-1]
MNPETKGPFRSADSGFGLIEIVISMFLLGLLAVAFLPLLVNSVRTTVTNSSIATATQLVNQEMKKAQLAGDTCALITAYGSTSVPVVSPDSRGVSYQPAHVVGPCPLAYPGTVPVTVSVTVVGSTLAPVTATTRIFVKAA